MNISLISLSKVNLDINNILFTIYFHIVQAQQKQEAEEARLREKTIEIMEKQIVEIKNELEGRRRKDSGILKN